MDAAGTPTAGWREAEGDLRGKSVRGPIQAAAKDFEELGWAVGLGQKVLVPEKGEVFSGHAGASAAGTDHLQGRVLGQKTLAHLPPGKAAAESRDVRILDAGA